MYLFFYFYKSSTPSELSNSCCSPRLRWTLETCEGREKKKSPSYRRVKESKLSLHGHQVQGSALLGMNSTTSHDSCTKSGQARKIIVQQDGSWTWHQHGMEDCLLLFYIFTLLIPKVRSMLTEPAWGLWHWCQHRLFFFSWMN